MVCLDSLKAWWVSSYNQLNTLANSGREVPPNCLPYVEKQLARHMERASHLPISFLCNEDLILVG